MRTGDKCVFYNFLWDYRESAIELRNKAATARLAPTGVTTGTLFNHVQRCLLFKDLFFQAPFSTREFNWAK